jgi:5-aminolevulinate synthase
MGEIMNMGVGSINCFTGPAFRRADYDALFDSALDQLRGERRYRDFVDLERLAGQFPHAIWHSPVGPRQVVI